VRLIAPLFAVAFNLATLGEAFGLHPCPHHDAIGVPGTPVVPEAVPASPAEHGPGHVLAAMGHDPHAAVLDEAGGHGSHHGVCTCMGNCQAGGGVGFAPTHAVPRLALAAVVTTWSDGVAPVSAPPRRAPRLIPFATAPPLLG
jgi:hypothetical protein